MAGGHLTAVDDVSVEFHEGKVLAADLERRLASGDGAGLDGSTAGLLARLQGTQDSQK